MNKKILVTGANGQLGRSLQKIQSNYPDCKFYFTDIDTLDICNVVQLIPIASFILPTLTR